MTAWAILSTFIYNTCFIKARCQFVSYFVKDPFINWSILIQGTFPTFWEYSRNNCISNNNFFQDLRLAATLVHDAMEGRTAEIKTEPKCVRYIVNITKVYSNVSCLVSIGPCSLAFKLKQYSVAKPILLNTLWYNRTIEYR